MRINILIFSLLVLVAAAVFPQPKSQQYRDQFITVNNICDIYHHESTHSLVSTFYYFKKIIKRLNKGIRCQPIQQYNSNLHTSITYNHLKQVHSEGYILAVNSSGIFITSSDYSGYVYALQTLSQIVKNGKIKHCLIQDQPVVQYRGIMIDSARHYLSVSRIKKLIQSMPLSKLNVLHWHLVDDESFPLQLLTHPELAQNANFGQNGQKLTYSAAQIRQIVSLAKYNAIQVIPEIDTPAHVRSWGLAQKWKDSQLDIKCNGGTGYNGQFDVSKMESWTLAKQVIGQVDGIFSTSKYYHLGGDEVSSNCWNLRPAIQDFMKKHNISSYGQLQNVWRSQLKSVVSSSKKVIFWRNDGANVKLQDSDILHYWGAQADVAKITSTSQSKIILSPSDILYLNKGQGNLWMNGTQGDYAVWKTIYQKFVLFPQGVDQSRILGAEVCLWGQVSNDDTLQNNLWMRASAFGARVWSSQILPTQQIVASLVQTQHTLYGMDVDASPVTSEFCEKKPNVCFPIKDTKQENDIMIE